jgi:hypothetical protein
MKPNDASAPSTKKGALRSTTDFGVPQGYNQLPSAMKGAPPSPMQNNLVAPEGQGLDRNIATPDPYPLGRVTNSEWNNGPRDTSTPSGNKLLPSQGSPEAPPRSHYGQQTVQSYDGQVLVSQDNEVEPLRRNQRDDYSSPPPKGRRPRDREEEVTNIHEMSADIEPDRPLKQPQHNYPKVFLFTIVSNRIVPGDDP